MLKRIIILVVVLFTLSTSVYASSLNGEFDGNPIIRLKSNGQTLSVEDVPAVMYKDRTMIPIYMLRQLGLDVNWDDATYSVDVQFPISASAKNIKWTLKQYRDILKPNNASDLSLSVSTSDNADIMAFRAKVTASGNADTDVKNIYMIASTGADLGADLSTCEFYVNGVHKSNVTISSSDINDFRAKKISQVDLINRYKVEREKLTAKEIAALVKQVGVITTFDYSNKPYAQGSGFIVDKFGMVITNSHVMNGARTWTAKVNGASYDSHWYVFDDPQNDLYGFYLISDQQTGKVDPNLNLDHLQLHNNLPEVGDKVFAIGSPNGLENTVSEGIVSGIRTVNGKTYIQHTAAIDHGSSGGALLNEYGEVIGVTSAGIDGGSLEGFAIPASYIQQELDKLK